jgi:hypothetical protein
MPIVSLKFKRTASHLFNTGINFFFKGRHYIQCIANLQYHQETGQTIEHTVSWGGVGGGGAYFLIKIAREWFTFFAFLLTIFCLVGGSLSVSHTPLHPHPLLCAPMFELYLFALFNNCKR